MDRPRREFVYQDATSHKFWAISLEGSSHTVNYGRVGTNGQTKTKEFASPEKALASYEKLVASKTKKGYVESEAGAPEAPAPAPKKAKTKPKPKAKTAATPAAAATPAPSAPAFAAPIPELGLPDWAWQAAAWRKLPPLERGEPIPFERKDGLKRLKTLQRGYKKKAEKGELDWSSVLPRAMTREEASFWFWALDLLGKDVDPKAVAAELEEQGQVQLVGKAEVELSLAVAGEKGITWPYAAGSHALAVYAQLLTPEELSDVLIAKLDEAGLWAVGWPSLGWHWAALDGFTQHVFPYLPESERERLRARVRRELVGNQTPWPVAYQEAPPMRLYFAALLGMSDVLRPILAARGAGQLSGSSLNKKPIRLLAGLESAAEVLAETARLGAGCVDPVETLTWLATTGREGVAGAGLAAALTSTDWTYSAHHYDTKQHRSILEGLDLPELVGPLLTQRKLKSCAKAANTWIAGRPVVAARGLLRLLDDPTLGELAWAALRELSGDPQAIEQALAEEDLSDALRAKVDQDVLGRGGPDEIDAGDLPPPLAEALAAVQGLKKKPAKAATAEWLEPNALSPLTVGGLALGRPATVAVLRALFECPPDPREAEFGRDTSTSRPSLFLLRALKEHADAEGLERFVWDLYSAWENRGAPSQQKWVLHGLAYLGGDETVDRLTPLVRAWPGQSQHARAVLGLECLRTIGSHKALGAIAGIAAKLKFRALKERAGDLLEEIAQSLKLDREQLADRLIPTCGLDADGQRVFDYGPRSFRFVLGPELIPMVQNDAGKLLKTPPKPGKKDDAETAPAALKEWRAFKKEVKATLGIQRDRLEQAMVSGRTWTAEEFREHIAGHPLLRNVANMLLWLDGYGSEAPVPFRLDDDQRAVDAKGQAFEPQGPVRLVHPLQLSAEERATWQALLDDLDLLPPFPQLEREVFTPNERELKGADLDRDMGAEAGLGSGRSLAGLLTKLGYLRGAVEDAGVWHEAFKPFPGSGVTAVLEHSGISVGGYEFGEAYVRRVRVYPGVLDIYDPLQGALDVADIPLLVVSEVLRDLSQIAAKARSRQEA